MQQQRQVFSISYCYLVVIHASTQVSVQHIEFVRLRGLAQTNDADKCCIGLVRQVMLLSAVRSLSRCTALSPPTPAGMQKCLIGQPGIIQAVEASPRSREESVSVA